MRIFWVISFGAVVLSAAILYRLRKVKHDGKIALWFVGAAFGVIGLVMLPLLATVGSDKMEITDYKKIKNESCVILDLSNSEGKYLYYPLIKFDTYEAVTEISDSTKFFKVTERSLYRVPMNEYYVWSNPPYNKFNRR